MTAPKTLKRRERRQRQMAEAQEQNKQQKAKAEQEAMDRSERDHPPQPSRPWASVCTISFWLIATLALPDVTPRMLLLPFIGRLAISIATALWPLIQWLLVWQPFYLICLLVAHFVPSLWDIAIAYDLVLLGSVCMLLVILFVVALPLLLRLLLKALVVALIMSAALCVVFPPPQSASCSAALRDQRLLVATSPSSLHAMGQIMFNASDWSHPDHKRHHRFGTHTARYNYDPNTRWAFLPFASYDGKYLTVDPPFQTRNGCLHDCIAFLNGGGREMSMHFKRMCGGGDGFTIPDAERICRRMDCSVGLLTPRGYTRIGSGAFLGAISLQDNHATLVVQARRLDSDLFASLPQSAPPDGVVYMARKRAAPQPLVPVVRPAARHVPPQRPEGHSNWTLSKLNVFNVQMRAPKAPKVVPQTGKQEPHHSADIKADALTPRAFVVADANFVQGNQKRLPTLYKDAQRTTTTLSGHDTLMDCVDRLIFKEDVLIVDLAVEFHQYLRKHPNVLDGPVTRAVAKRISSHILGQFDRQYASVVFVMDDARRTSLEKLACLGRRLDGMRLAVERGKAVTYRHPLLQSMVLDEMKKECMEATSPENAFEALAGRRKILVSNARLPEADVVITRLSWLVKRRGRRVFVWSSDSELIACCDGLLSCRKSSVALLKRVDVMRTLGLQSPQQLAAVLCYSGGDGHPAVRLRVMDPLTTIKERTSSATTLMDCVRLLDNVLFSKPSLTTNGSQHLATARGLLGEVELVQTKGAALPLLALMQKVHGANFENMLRELSPNDLILRTFKPAGGGEGDDVFPARYRGVADRPDAAWLKNDATHPTATDVEVGAMDSHLQSLKVKTKHRTKPLTEKQLAAQRRANRKKNSHVINAKKMEDGRTFTLHGRAVAGTMDNMRNSVLVGQRVWNDAVEFTQGASRGFIHAAQLMGLRVTIEEVNAILGPIGEEREEELLQRIQALDDLIEAVQRTHRRSPDLMPTLTLLSSWKRLLLRRGMVNGELPFGAFRVLELVRKSHVEHIAKLKKDCIALEKALRGDKWNNISYRDYLLQQWHVKAVVWELKKKHHAAEIDSANPPPDVQEAFDVAAGLYPLRFNPNHVGNYRDGLTVLVDAKLRKFNSAVDAAFLSEFDQLYRGVITVHQLHFKRDLAQGTSKSRSKFVVQCTSNGTDLEFYCREKTVLVDNLLRLGLWNHRTDIKITGGGAVQIQLKYDAALPDMAALFRTPFHERLHTPMEAVSVPVAGRVAAADPGINSLFTVSGHSSHWTFGDEYMAKAMRLQREVSRLQAELALLKKSNPSYADLCDVKRRIRNVYRRLGRVAKGARDEFVCDIVSSFGVFVLPTFYPADFKLYGAAGVRASAACAFGFAKLHDRLHFMEDHSDGTFFFHNSIGEEFTTQGCAFCGMCNPKIGTSRLFCCCNPKCSHAGRVMGRDEHAAFNIKVKACVELGGR